MATHVKVLIRVRPLLPHEEGATMDLVECGSNYIRINYNNGTNKTFTFDKVMNPSCTQSVVFEEVDPLIDRALDGLHATVFCYGQTGSGKTFTMEGFDYGVTQNGKLKALMEVDPDQHGVILRTIDCIFAKVQSRMEDNANIRYKLQCSYMQIYNEKVFDLLNPNATAKAAEKGKGASGGLRVRWGKDDQFFVENLFIFECDSPEQVRELFQMGVKNKSMGSHQMNLASSRSHSIFTMYVSSWDPEVPDCVIRSQLTLVDLAGSEKLALLAKNPSGKLVQESIDINTSLLALGKVIQALGSDQKGTHVPYRDSKLTRLLKHALGGNSMTIMIACINPADHFVDETLCTLYYAGRARNIKNDPHVNEDPKSALIRALKEEVAQLKLELDNYRKLLLEDNSALGQAALMKKVADGDVSNGDVQDGEAKYLAERLVESVRILRDLVDANGQLRSNFDKIHELKVKAEVMVQQVNEENVELRERIEMLESIVVQQVDDDEPAVQPDEPREVMGGTGKRRAKKALSMYNQRYKARQAKGLPDYNEIYHKPKGQPSQPRPAEGPPGILDRQHQQQERLQQYQQQHLEQLQEQQRQRLLQQQQYQQQLAQYYQMQQQHQQHQQQQQSHHQNTQYPQHLHQPQQPQHQLQQQQPHVQAISVRTNPGPTISASQDQSAPPQRPMQSVAQPNVPNVKASVQAQNAAALWMQHKGTTDAARQQVAQQQQVIQQQQLYLQQQLYQQQQLLQMQMGNRSAPLQNTPAVERKTHSSPSTITRLPAVGPEVLSGSRVSHTASPVRASSSGAGGATMTPQPSTAPGTRSGAPSSSYLTLDEYKQHFTPEQLAILAKRNAMNNNFVQK